MKRRRLLSQFFTRIFTALLFIYRSTSLCAQDVSVDSLYALYPSATEKQRIEIVNKIAQTVYHLQCTDTLFHVTEETPELLLEAITNELIASYAMYIQIDYERSNSFTLRAAKCYEQLGDTMDANIMYGNMANNHLRMSNFEQAIEILLQCFEREEKRNDTEGLSSTFHSLGTAYSYWGQNQTAIDYFTRSLEVERPLNRPMQYATRLGSLAKEYKILGQHENALSLIKEALMYDEQMVRREKEERIAVHLLVMGDIYYEMDSLPQANKCFEQAIETFTEKSQQNRLAESYLSIGKLRAKERRPDESIQLLERCVSICNQYNMRPLLLDAYRLLYEVHKQKQPVSEALTYMEKYKTLSDSLFQETTQKQMNEFRTKYQTQQKELEIVHQQAEIDRHQSNQILFVISLSLSGMVLILLAIMLRLRTKRNRILAEANATKDKFFSIISHDLKNPAIAQRDALQLLTDRFDTWDTDSLSQYYNELLRSADGQVELLYNLLNWAQVQTGRMPYSPTPFDLVAALQPDISLIKNMAERKGIKLDIQLPETAIVTGDSNMLSTVVRNLLTNAVKFTAADGTVSLCVNETEQKRYTISVSDTGTGMSEQQLQDLFRIDRQRSRTGTAGEQGSGLGLIVCKELVEKHGNTLHVESEENKGSRFWFVLNIV